MGQHTLGGIKTEGGGERPDLHATLPSRMVGKIVRKVGRFIGNSPTNIRKSHLYLYVIKRHYP